MLQILLLHRNEFSFRVNYALYFNCTHLNMIVSMRRNTSGFVEKYGIGWTPIIASSTAW